MNYICKDSSIGIREMKDCINDYNLMLDWLSNPVVLKYYEGLNSVFDLQNIIKKYRPRITGVESVVAYIIEICDKPVGYIQYYPIKSDEDYDLKGEITLDFSKTIYGLDLFIADETNRNCGFGTKTIKLILNFLFKQKNANKVFIDPQTWNIRAIKCYKKCGFKPIKVIEKRELCNGELKDSLIMCIAREEIIT
ncbi:MAG: GNAT family protein [Eubacteriales bacterium]|nr:GNAT family protein [Eubacteriales bacterium]MDD4421436.1 GNAT family protein [Eubacteriales bacterium]